MPEAPAASPPPIALRPLAPGEAGLLLPLVEPLHHIHASCRPDVFHEAGGPAERQAELAEILARPGWFCLLAEDARGPAGYVLAELQVIEADAFRCGRRRGFVHHIATRADLRRQGIASALLAAAQDRFRAEGATVWATTYWAWNAASAALMAKAGLAPAIILADAPLD